MTPENIKDQTIDEKIVESGIALGITEWGLGSLLHALQIPFTGQVLSLNQIYLLSSLTLSLRKTDRERYFTATAVGLMAAGLKAMAPIGRKFGPVLSISMQGFLFDLGILCCEKIKMLKNSSIKIYVAAALSSIWAVFWPLIQVLLVFGLDFQQLGQAIENKLFKNLFSISDFMFYFFGSFLLIKIGLALSLVYSLIHYSQVKMPFRWAEKIRINFAKKLRLMNDQAWQQIFKQKELSNHNNKKSQKNIFRYIPIGFLVIQGFLLYTMINFNIQKEMILLAVLRWWALGFLLFVLMQTQIPMRLILRLLSPWPELKKTYSEYLLNYSIQKTQKNCDEKFES